MDYCLMSAARGDPQAQAMVAQFYLDGSTPASQAQGLAWLQTMARNRSNGNLASAARFRLSTLMARAAPSTLLRARELMVHFDAH